MVNAMTYREMAAALSANGCTSKPGIVSPGLVREAIRRLDFLPKGWLQ